MGKIGNSVKAFLAFLFKVICVLPLLIFGIWLLQLLYFPDFSLTGEDAAATPKGGGKMFMEILNRKEAVPREHFHMIDEYISKPDPDPPVCSTCHGTYPHSKEAKVRSILNSHTGFIDCSVCHSRKDSAKTKMDFAWVNRENGVIAMDVEGAYGKYPAKIVMVKIKDGGERQIFEPVDKDSAKEFLKIKDLYNPDQIAEAKVKLHGNITPKPVFCSDCHQKEGYLNFLKLGFPKARIVHLNSTEVVGLVEKYKTFYLPSVIDFGKENP